MHYLYWPSIIHWCEHLAHKFSLFRQHTLILKSLYTRTWKHHCERIKRESSNSVCHLLHYVTWVHYSWLVGKNDIWTYGILYELLTSIRWNVLFHLLCGNFSVFIAIVDHIHCFLRLTYRSNPCAIYLFPSLFILSLLHECRVYNNSWIRWN